MTPVQRIIIPEYAQPLWEAVQNEPVGMTEKCLKSRACKTLLELGLVVYEEEKLRLMKDC